MRLKLNGEEIRRRREKQRLTQRPTSFPIASRADSIDPNTRFLLAAPGYSKPSALPVMTAP